MIIIGGPPERQKPLNVGILMFSEHPEKYFHYARIEVVDIPDPTGSNMIEQTFTGPIQRQLTNALSYIKNYVIKTAIIKVKDQAEAVTVYNYPFEAIEEILSNAVYHRSYQVNEPITVKITPSCIEITSFHSFDRIISDQQIEQDGIIANVYRNRRIGDFLKKLHLIKGRNTGYPNARKALANIGSPKLRFEINIEREYLSVYIDIHEYFKATITKQDKYVEKILKILKTSPMSLTELSTAMGYKGITAKLSKTVNSLIDQNKIQLIIGNDKAIKLSIIK
ncbi:MAG: hypothetical protein K6G87_13500 [Butyrivibrio sp.]|uniref:hypothetical protein n=1 Tax=Butyrivibrio sp. TaxID=28121 RepID=UPI0025D3FD73|nr:hypothetical protein [Butyrivibrio sp.]MCR5772231.1 hypothetical protein [Butyrivibrio sp.]